MTAYTSRLDGLQIIDHRIQNAQGTHCLISNYGARILQIHTHDKDGKLGDIVLGHDSIAEYLDAPHTFFGACVGRVANRTSNAAFSLEGKKYTLPANEALHHLHGGAQGFHNRVWKVLEHHPASLLLQLYSPDGDEGYPGNVTATLRYTLLENNSLEINYEAHSDRTTPLNLTNHSYFNLDGGNKNSIDTHTVQINASQYCPIKEDFIPTGIIENVEGSPFDFRKEAPLLARLKEEHPQLRLARGFDHHYVIGGHGMRAFAKIWSTQSGRSLEVWSDASGMQFYTGNFLDGSVLGKSGVPCGFRSAFCMETQSFPNSLNTPQFPDIIFGPEKPYRSSTTYKFGITAVAENR